ncbi:dihydroorotase [Microbulbifer flavimaris]|uniref:Dihydroorotase n=1 Tax=Microbulbifer flavimaris TaxID=1781068 RepID=A0ABX4I3D9_9GAMM|nr:MULTISPECIES: dihydroorotase [Microbulbifer]KUJ84772.1 dihydroorotase [Microbulbifer sp. ZGT114]PCO06866.1 dihydroorotase [Microbulbifer flavimaris]
MMTTLIKNARLVNEGEVLETDLRIVGDRIDKIATEIAATSNDKIIDAAGCHLLPGMIDDQVHFREPGLTHKGNIASESRAAVAGGITSYMEMPNVNPATTTIEALEKKFAIASRSSAANFSFYLGATEDNLEQIKLLDPAKHCGVKVFMGASTGDLLVEHPEALDAIFRESPTLIVTHCESSPIIRQNREALLRSRSVLTIEDHPRLRDTNACFASSSYAVGLAKKYGSELHVLHITTEKELELFEAGPVQSKQITAEACVHHLWFTDQDYPRLGNLIKCNPSIKGQRDRDALIQALDTNQIDIVATDHAPHTWEEKQVDYEQAPAGLPLVQHALLSMLEHVKQERLSLTQVVEKTAHNPALRYGVVDRGFVREGYFADLVLVDNEASTTVTHENSLYNCGWSPFAGQVFSSKIIGTWVNGQMVYDTDGIAAGEMPAMRLDFAR